MGTIKGPKVGGAQWRRMRAWGTSPKVRLGSIKFPCGVNEFFEEHELFPEEELKKLWGAMNILL